MSKRAEQFHASPWLGALYLTGGGSGLIDELLSTPGASASVLEVQVPYANQALAELIGQTPEQACSALTARQLAMAAMQRTQNLGEGQLFGLGCSASLATNRPKKGTHRAHWAIQTKTETASFYAQFTSERAAEEHQLVEHIWNALHHVLFGEKLNPEIECIRESGNQTLLEKTPTRICTTSDAGKLILPGSFNPLHAGHMEMLRVAEKLTGLAGAYELTTRNADKPALDFVTLSERQAQFSTRPLWITNVATYGEKAKLFPGTTFCLGTDTLERIGALRFYQDRQDLLDQALEVFHTLNIKFLVFGRDQDGFKTLADLRLPSALSELCQAVPESEYRMDISSTELRSR